MNARAIDRDRVVALAGMFQAAVLTQQLARTGEADPDAMAASVRSILINDALDTPSVFGGCGGIDLGLRTVVTKMSRRADTRDLEVAGYVMALTQLEGKLRGNAQMQTRIRRELGELQAREDVQALGPELFAALAELYTQTLSLIRPPIVVHGQEGHLADAGVVDRVRAALLAGVRAAHLWHQLGGRRWHLILKRGAYVDGARALLAEAA